MNRTLKIFSVLALFAAPVAAQNTPIVTVLAFDNNSVGPGHTDWDGMGKGIMDLMITDLASGTKVRVVDRERVNKLLEEQNLTKSGAIDANTAIRVGKLFGACYSIYGGYMRLASGEQVLTIRTTNNETGQVENPVKFQTKNDNVLEVIAEATAKFISGMNVKACQGTAGARRDGDAAPAQQQSQAATSAQQQSQAQAATPAQQKSQAPAATPAAAKQPETIQYSKALSAAEMKQIKSVKLDARTMLIYSRALDAKDRNDKPRAKQLAQQVKDKYPEFSPADKLIASLNSGS
jgi:TolB-like protein